ncbi:hypothetical protein [Nocardia sp. R7R-8]|uniref:hypothetical protein n=1 Tax=Nocardia sp. R7R-8 TaxID=3459304 RepID=UPI00403E1F12
MLAIDRRGVDMTSPSNFEKFVKDMSEASNRLDAYENAPEELMEAYGLTEDEKAVIREGNEDAILQKLGFEVSDAPRFRLRIRNIRIRLT